MIIVCKTGTSESDLEMLVNRVEEYGYEPRLIQGVERTVIACVGDEIEHQSLTALRALPMVEDVMPVQKRYKLASREFRDPSMLELNGVKIGAGHFGVIAGPCSVESLEQMTQVCEDLQKCGIRLLRGGTFKPRTSPYDFQGLGEEGLAILQKMKDQFGFSIVTEVLGVEQVEDSAKVADILQIGARNCQNYHLLTKVAEAGRPVLIKRGLATTIEEWLLAAEYLCVNGCEDVILCERGIRTYETASRFTLDVTAIAVAKRESHLPVVVDPSHPAGRVDLVLPLAKAGIAAGADGIIVETHPNPAVACSDAAQQIPSAEFQAFLDELKPFVDAAGLTWE